MNHRDVVAAYVRAFNDGDIEALRRVFAPEALIHGALGWGGFDEVAPIWTQLHASFGMQLVLDDLVERDDAVVARFTERGHFVAAFRGQAPTGLRSEVVAIEWFEMRDGLIRRRWGARDSASHFRQLGIHA